MIKSEQVKPHAAEQGSAYVVHYSTPKGEGKERFGGYDARAKATRFAVSKLEELRSN